MSAQTNEPTPARRTRHQPSAPTARAPGEADARRQPPPPHGTSSTQSAPGSSGSSAPTGGPASRREGRVRVDENPHHVTQRFVGPSQCHEQYAPPEAVELMQDALELVNVRLAMLVENTAESRWVIPLDLAGRFRRLAVGPTEIEQVPESRSVEARSRAAVLPAPLRGYAPPGLVGLSRLLLMRRDLPLVAQSLL